MAKRDLPGDPERQPLRGIQDVATELGVATRTIRFYEDKGLLEPQRVGTMRVYSRREVGRLQLILRGKRLGFSIQEIREILDLYDTNVDEVPQLTKFVEVLERRRQSLLQQREDIDSVLSELDGLARQSRKLLSRGKRKP